MTHMILRLETRRLPTWLTSVRVPETLTATAAERNRRNQFVSAAIAEFGVKAALLLPYYELVNLARHARQKLYVVGPKPAPASSLLRREWVGLGSAVGAVALMVSLTGTTGVVQTRPALAPSVNIASSAPAPVTNTLAVLSAKADTGFVETGPVTDKQVDFGSLAGRNMGTDLNALYSGVQNGAPKVATINYLENLRRMYDRKLDIKNVSLATQKEVPKILARYNAQRTLTTLPAYAADIQKRIDAANAGMDWQDLCTRLGVNRDGGDGCALLQASEQRSNADEALAYSATEFLPNAKDGRFNATLYDLLLRNAGIEYIGSLPAVHDTYLSLGGWQFTSNAVFRTRADGKDARGASIVSMFAPKELQIPWSTARLARGDHDLAAKYFGTYNVANLIGCPKVLRKGTWVPDCATLKQRAVFHTLLATRAGMDQIAIYKAIAHHNPTYARIYTRKWLEAGAPGKLSDHLGRVLTIYARKTEVNLAGIRWFMSNHEPSKGERS